MDIFSSDSILLHKTLYKDFKYILKIYTKDFGLITADVLLNHQIQHAHIQPLLLAKVQYTKTKTGKYSVLQIQPSYIYRDIYSDIKKNCIAQTVQEIIIKSISHEQSDNALFLFIEDTLKKLDTHNNESNLKNFLINFLKQYINLMGISPYNNYSPEFPYFELQDGRFVSTQSIHCLNKEDSIQIYLFFHQQKQTEKSLFPITITELMIRYLKYHLNINHLDSLELVKELVF